MKSLKDVNIFDVIAINCMFYILNQAPLTNFDRLGLIGCVGWMFLRIYHLTKDTSEIRMEDTTNRLCKLGSHDWQTYDPPHWRYCKRCGLEQSYDIGFDSKEWEDIRINQKLIGKSIDTSDLGTKGETQ